MTYATVDDAATDAATRDCAASISFRATVVSARETDATLPAAPPHLVYSPDGCARRQVLIFLPGTGEAPSSYRLFLGHAASLGYHALGVSYPNAAPLRDLCDRAATQLDPDCHEKIRLEMITGADDATTTFQPSAAGSILDRLDRLLAYLVATDVAAGWSQFYRSDAIQWSSVVLAGHSQGGGHAGLMASKLFSVARVVFFSSPGDYWVPDASMPQAVAAPWTRPPHLTEAGRYFGFIHTAEDAYVTVPLVWTNFGMPTYGGLVNADALPPPFDDTRQVQSSVDPGTGPADRVLNYDVHASVVMDDYTPRVGQAAVHIPVWTYLLTGNP